MVKKSQEISVIAKGGKILGILLEKLSFAAQPGVRLCDIDTLAEQLIQEAGGEPAFKGYRGKPNDPPFSSVICACVNEELVHAPANRDRVLQDGDILSIDIGMRYPALPETGFYTDTALTVAVGSVPRETALLLERTRQSLEEGIAAARAMNTVADIGRAVEKYLTPFGYGIVRALVGHGVGYRVHEPPQIPNHYTPEADKIPLVPGMVLALEPMVTLGSSDVVVLQDGWTVVPVDRSLCAHFEHTLVITADAPLVVTRRPQEQYKR